MGSTTGILRIFVIRNLAKAGKATQNYVLLGLREAPGRYSCLFVRKPSLRPERWLCPLIYARWCSMAQRVAALREGR